MAYIGPEPNPGQNREVDDISSGFNGSEVNFTLQVNSQNVSPGSPNNIIVSLGGVVQNPGTDYTVAASTLTFTTAPASGLSFFGLVLGQQVDIQSLADGTSPTMSAPSITGDLSIADKIVHTGDTNNAIRFPAADTIAAETAGAERLRVDSSGNLLLGHSSARPIAGSTNRKFQIEATDASASLSITRVGANSAGGFLSFGKSRSASTGGNTIVNDGDVLGTISFAGADGTNLESRGVDIQAAVDGTPGVDDMPGRLIFKTSADGSVSTTERMRIDKDGHVGIGMSPSGVRLDVQSSVNDIARFTGPNSGGITFRNDTSNEIRLHTATSDALIFGTNGNNERMRIDSSGQVGIGTISPDRLLDVIKGGTNLARFQQTTNNQGSDHACITLRHAAATASAQGVGMVFQNTGGSDVGSIRFGASTSYNTSSDYRLKENAVPISDGITRLKTLKPYKFNWISDDTNTLVDGFFAHEVTAVPEAISGTKDEVDSDNNPIYQGIDQSKLVPLLTAALQEAITKIETLETKVAALEAA